MKRGGTQGGFTVVETMIFLAVSAALLISALTLVNGSRSKTEFNQGINDFQQQINSIASNVSTGYFPGTDALACKNVSGSQVLDTSGVAQSIGTNDQCVYIGIVLKFGSDDTFNAYTVAGARRTTTAISKEVTQMSEAKPTLVGPVQQIKLKNGLRVKWVRDDTNINAVGFFSTFGQLKAGSSNDLDSGAQQYDFIGINDLSGLTNPITSPASYIQGIGSSSFRNTYNTKVNPSQGISICIETGAANRTAILKIGGDSRTATLTLAIKNENCNIL